MIAKKATTNENTSQTTSRATARIPALLEKDQSVRAAEEFLRDKDLVGRIVGDIGLMGVAGEEGLSLTLYMVALSRALEKPLGARVHGASGSGKSYIAATIALALADRSRLG